MTRRQQTVADGSHAHAAPPARPAGEASGGTSAAAGRRICFLVAVDWYFCMHWLPLARAVSQAGYEVTVITEVTDTAEAQRIKAAGLRLLPFQLSRRGLNPVEEWRSLRHLLRLLRSERPDLVHAVGQKPVLYGAVAARRAGIPAYIGTLAGMGYLFTSTALKARLLRPVVVAAYRRLLVRPTVRVTVQNPDDQAQLRRSAGIDATLIRGVGVDLTRFQPAPAPPDPVTVVLASRMLWAKGLRELAGAATQLRDAGVTARFVLVGKPDPGNPEAVPESQLRAWHASGAVEWWGPRSDMPAVLRQAHIVCLPSYYREGLPTILIEAAAAGLPLVTTDTPGCREVVRPGRNGLLVPPRDVGALAAALRRLIDDSALRERYGRESRHLAETEFAIGRVTAATLSVYRDLLSAVAGAPPAD
jgi:glycosyltransferase involved in cell wall biosynthesis